MDCTPLVASVTLNFDFSNFCSTRKYQDLTRNPALNCSKVDYLQDPVKSAKDGKSGYHSDHLGTQKAVRGESAPLGRALLKLSRLYGPPLLQTLEHLPPPHTNGMLTLLFFLVSPGGSSVPGETVAEDGGSGVAVSGESSERFSPPAAAAEGGSCSRPSVSSAILLAESRWRK